jgi:peptide/nickel transport system substrate-binding protein
MTRFPLALISLVLALVVTAAPAGGAPDQTPRRGGTVVVLRPPFTELPCLNPLACGGDWDPLLLQVLEGAFEAGPDLVFRPNLVSDVTPGRNPFTLTYRIRPEARWSDGVPVTASDFQFTQEAFAEHFKDPEQGYVNVRSTRVLDAKTFRVELDRPFAAWRYLYSVVLPRHALAGEDLTKVWRDRIDNPKSGRPIGSGPFLFARWERGRQLELVRNPRYWGPHTAYLDRFVNRFVREDPGDLLGPLERNEVDAGLTLGSAFLSADAARQVRQLPGWRVAVWPGPAMEHFVFRVGSGGHPALKLKLVRQALAFGVDRVAIAREIQREAPASVRRPLDSTVFLPSEASYRPTWSRYRYDVARARRLLGQAGCRRGSDGVYECAGERLRLRLVTSAGAPDRQRIVELAAAHLRQVGVDAVPVYAAPPVFLGRILPNGDFDVALFSWGGVFGGVGVWPEALCGNEQNFGGYCSRLVTRDAQQNLIGTLAQRARVLHAVDAKLAKAVPVLPIVQPVGRAFYRQSLRGVVHGGGPFEFTQNAEDWWLADSR